MIPSRAFLLLTAAVLCAHPAAGQTMPLKTGPVAATLQRDDAEDNSELPYRRATLDVKYESSSPISAAETDSNVVRGVSIRSLRGGPTMFYPVTIPPETPGRKISVLVPAMSAEDTYRVALLSGPSVNSPVIAELELTIDWPADWVTSQMFLDPEAYDDGDFLPPVWSNRTLQLVFVIAAATCVLLGAILMIRRAAWRVAVASITIIAAGAGLWRAANAEPIILRQLLGENERLLLVSCIRDASCEISPPHTVPLYYNMEEMSQDNAVVLTEGKLTVELKSGAEVRLFASQGVK